MLQSRNLLISQLTWVEVEDWIFVFVIGCSFMWLGEPLISAFGVQVKPHEKEALGLEGQLHKIVVGFQSISYAQVATIFKKPSYLCCLSFLLSLNIKIMYCPFFFCFHRWNFYVFFFLTWALSFVIFFFGALLFSWNFLLMDLNFIVIFIILTLLGIIDILLPCYANMNAMLF